MRTAIAEMERGKRGAAGVSQQRNASQKGYTIVELSIAVAIAGVLLVSAIALVQNVLQTNRANESITLITRAMAQIDKIWADQPTYAGMTLATAGAAGVFQGIQVARNAAGQVTGVTSKFNRPIYIGTAPNIPTAGANRGYAITFAGVPTPVCADLVTAAAGGGVRGILISLEAAAAATVAAVIPAGMNADGSIPAPAAGAAVNYTVAMDGSLTTPNLANALGVNGCGTANATVALTFLNWK